MGLISLVSPARHITRHGHGGVTGTLDGLVDTKIGQLVGNNCQGRIRIELTSAVLTKVDEMD
jgi:hypothetical protein